MLKPECVTGYKIKIINIIKFVYLLSPTKMRGNFVDIRNIRRRNNTRYIFNVFYCYEYKKIKKHCYIVLYIAHSIVHSICPLYLHFLNVVFIILRRGFNSVFFDYVCHFPTMTNFCLTI